MQRSGRVSRRWLWVVIGLALLVALVPYSCIVWDGGFPSIECRLRFVDTSDGPVPGVTLKVLTKADGACHFYPVDELLPDSTPTSDADGKMVFHHANCSPEFSGRIYENLIGIPFGEIRAPQYLCVFLQGDREVFRCPFRFHQKEWDEFRQPNVTRAWRSPGWDFQKYGWDGDEDSQVWKMRLFDTNHDGKLDREEEVAAHSFARQLEREPGPHRTTEEISFQVVECTIVVPNP